MAHRDITVGELAALGEGVRLIDVREPSEFEEIRVPYAVLLPLGSVPDHLDLFHGDASYLICRSGGRSARACEFLAEQGFDVVNVEGGMIAWCDAELVTASGAVDG